MTPDIVYVPMNWSLLFCVHQYTRSHTTPDIVYVPMNWSLQFWFQSLIQLLTWFMFLLTCHYNFGYRGTHFRVQHASRFCANFVLSTHHDFARFSAPWYPFSCSACITILHKIGNYSLHFHVCPDLPQIPTSLKQ